MHPRADGWVHIQITLILILTVLWMDVNMSSREASMETLQQSGVQVSERLASPGMMKAQLWATPKPLEHHSSIVSRGHQLCLYYARPREPLPDSHCQFLQAGLGSAVASRYVTPARDEGHEDVTSDAPNVAQVLSMPITPCMMYSASCLSLTSIAHQMLTMPDTGPKPQGQKPQVIFLFLILLLTLYWQLKFWNLLVPSERSSSDLTEYTLFRIVANLFRFGARFARVRIEDSSRNRFALNGIQRAFFGGILSGYPTI